MRWNARFRFTAGPATGRARRGWLSGAEQRRLRAARSEVTAASAGLGPLAGQRGSGDVAPASEVNAGDREGERVTGHDDQARPLRWCVRERLCGCDHDGGGDGGRDDGCTEYPAARVEVVDQMEDDLHCGEAGQIDGKSCENRAELTANHCAEAEPEDRPEDEF